LQQFVSLLQTKPEAFSKRQQNQQIFAM